MANGVNNTLPGMRLKPIALEYLVLALPVLVLLALLALPAPTALAQNGIARIGYVDMKQLLDNAPQIAISREAIDREFRPQNDAIASDEQRLQDLRAQLQSPDADRLRLENRIRDLELSINRRREDLRQQILFRRNEAIQALEDDINQAVAAVARGRNYDLIISSPVIYANDTVDLTQAVLNYLQLQSQSGNN